MRFAPINSSSLLVGLFGLASLALPIGAAQAAGTIAGTEISNIAQATYDNGGGPVTIDSNEVKIRVDELLDVTVASGNPGDVTTTPGATQQVLTYQVTNTGNGNESFTLTADGARPGDDFDTTIEQIILDTNNNGVYDPGIDTVYVAGSNDPVIAPDSSITIFVLSTIPATPVDGNRAEVSLLAVATTGSGAPGTTFAGAGDGGGNAVVGSTGADSTASGFFRIQAATIAIVKSATVLDPFGGSNAVPGATITYRLVATTTGGGALPNLHITDAVPANTTYAASSITLEGAALTDTADADAGRFTGTGIDVSLGNLPGGQTRTVTFKVTIN
ncbi:MAG: hypothetical protein U5J78_01065 [Parasphingorhabdus sp.]|nr:hypothetical protein [Parasphingorhabdus sp.]